MEIIEPLSPVIPVFSARRGKMKVVKMQRRKIRLDSAFFSM